MATRRTVLDPIDSFSLSPMLELVPREGNVGKLEHYTAALFARYDTVTQSRSEAEDKESSRRLASEEAMLRQVLDWLELKLSEDGGE